MNSLAALPVPPHIHDHPRFPSTRSMSTSAATPSQRKRKASPASEDDDRMNTSPSMSNARLPIAQPISRKRVRTNLEGRPLSFERLLETLDKDSLTTLLRTLTDSHPNLKDEVVHLSPRPSIQSTLQVLHSYYEKLTNAFPLDPNPRSDYCFDRVRPQWQDLLNALADFTPHFLPPNESNTNVSLDYLDGVTEIIHKLPEWDTPSHNLAKQNAYEEISRAWATVIKEASKRGGGFQLQYAGWEDKIRSHNERSRGMMKEAWESLAASLGWLRSGSGVPGQIPNQGFNSRESIRQQLFSGTYGTDGQSMRTGMW